MIKRIISFLSVILSVCWLSASLEAAIYNWNGAAGTSGWYDTRQISTDPVLYVNNFGMVDNPPAFPGQTDDVHLGGYTVETTGMARVNTIDLSGDLRIRSADPLVVYSAITNNGVIRINDTVSGSSANLIIYNQVSLGGTGRILFSGGTEDDNYLDYATPSSRLTIGSGQTIASEVPGGVGYIAVQIVNQGLIDADAGTIHLQDYAKTNQNLFRARNGGTLKILGSCSVENSAGRITAEANSLVDIGGSCVVTGGLINGAGTLQISGTASIGDLTLETGLVDIQTGDTLNLTGMVTNNTTIKLTDFAYGGAYLNAKGEATLAGTGKVLFAISPTGDDDQYIDYNITSDRLIIGA